MSRATVVELFIVNIQTDGYLFEGAMQLRMPSIACHTDVYRPTHLFLHQKASKAKSLCMNLSKKCVSLLDFHPQNEHKFIQTYYVSGLFKLGAFSQNLSVSASHID